MNTLKNILVATDFTPDSQTALDEAVALAQKFQSTVYVLHTVDKIEECAVDYCLTDAQVEGAKNKLIGEAQRKMDNEIGRFRGIKNVSIVPDLRYGRTLDEILQEERDKNIDLLVIGPHAKRTFWQRLSSHLSEKLVNNSMCDTLVVQHAA